MLSLLNKLIGRTPSQLVCPHCEKEMEADHDVDRCARKRMSRRFFFGIVGGAAAATAVAQVLTTSPVDQFVITDAVESASAGCNIFLTPDIIARECLAVLRSNLALSKEVSRTMEREFSQDLTFITGTQWARPSTLKIGDQITIRKPPRFLRSVA